MCKQCAKEGEKPDDRIKLHDEDVKLLYTEGLNVDDVLMVAFDRLEAVPDDQNARNLFYVIATLFYQTDPVYMYQSFRKDREMAIDGIAKALGR